MNNVEQYEAVKKLKALRESMLEDIIAMPDEELLAEMRENGLDPTEVAQKLRMKALELIAKERKRRFTQVCPTLEKASIGSQIKRRPTMETMKQRIQEIYATKPEFSLAFRNGEHQSDSDIENLWENLVELGVISDDV